MSGSAQIFPVVGSNFNLPTPLPTQDVSDGTPGSTAPSTALQVAGTDGTDLRVLSTDTSGRQAVIGSLTNNNAAPAATEIGVLPALANAAAPTWTEGDQVLESVDLAGNQRVVLNTETTKVIGTVNQGTSPWVVSGTVTTVPPTNTNTTTGDSTTLTSASPGPVNGATQTNLNARGAIVTALLGIVSGTLPTLTMQIQWSPDGGTTWINYGSATSAATVATGSTLTVVVYPTVLTAAVGTTGSIATDAPLPKTWRMVYTGGGTAFSIAFVAVYVNYIL